MAKSSFYQTDVYKVIQAMKATGNQPGVVKQWKELMQIWALDRPGIDGDAMRAWMPYWKVRPFYTATELVPLFPVLAVAFGFAQRASSNMGANRLANLLDFGGLPTLTNGTDGGRDFRSPVTGLLDRYFIVERLHYWRDRDTTQTEFEAEFL